MIRALIQIMTAGILVFCTSLYSEQSSRKFNSSNSSYPNILIITVDNIGYGDYNLFNPKSKIITPALEKMAKEGAILTGFYSAGATCTVSRATLLTGRLPQRNQLNHQLSGIAGNYGIGLRQSEILLPMVIKNSPGDYATAAFGKWNIGFAPGSRPTDRGFDEFLGIVSGNADHFTHVYAGKHDLYHNTEPVNRRGEYSTDMFANATTDFIIENTAKSKPWFIYLPFDAPHSPGERNIEPGEINKFQAPDYAFEPYDFSPDETDPAKRYMAVITAIDMALGRILNTLDSLNISENTFIFFYSDNGANVGAIQERITGTQFSSNSPFRGGRSTLYEGGIRIPAIVKWKGKIKSGSKIDTRLWSPDLFTACAKLTGSEMPQDRFIDGMNPIPVLTGKTKYSPHATLFFEIGKFSALHWADWKIVRDRPDSPWQLYNLKNDLSSQSEDIVKKLSAAFEQKKAELENDQQLELSKD